ncbi:Factor arrest protein 11 [Naganishia albida]|nr:Factor arrest protein 11 [Naganishia albida]
MMQRPQPAPVPAKPSDPTPESSQPVVDSDRTTSDAEIAAMQPSMSYASRVPPQNQGQTQVGTGDTPKTNGPTLLRRPILQRGSSGPSAPEGQAGGPVRPGARSLGPAAGAAQTQQAPPGMAGLAGADGGDGLGGALPKAKPQQFDFHYDDTSDILSELSEFFPYAEMAHLLDNLHEYQIDAGKETKWTEESPASRRNYVQLQVEFLEHRDLEERMKAARRLTYLLQGNFAECAGPDYQLHWIIENAGLVRTADGLSSAIVALKDACARHDLIARAMSMHEQNAQLQRQSPGHPPNPPPAPSQHHIPEELQRAMEDTNSEIGVYLGIIYFVIEVFRHDEMFGDELMAMDQPLPVYLLNLVASLRDKSHKGFPVKKLLLVVWKTILACFGGLKDVRKAVALQRDLAGLPSIKRDFTKVSPAGMTNFHKEITVKYPTFEVPDAVKKSTLNPERLAEAMSPIPVRSHYHTSIEDGLPSTFVSRAAMQQRNPAAQPHQGPGSFPQPGTPAPSPPPTPPMKQKKQQYQTDQSRPFVFPFSRSEMPGPSRMVPFAIDEAEKLYSRHIHISLGLYQLQKTREDYIREESGLGMSGLIGFTTSEFDDDIEDAGDKAWQDYQAMDWRYEEQEMLAESKGDAFAAKAAKQARASLKRLYRVERVYKAILPYSQSIVVVLLKLLLATVTGNPAANANVQHGSPGAEVPEVVETPPQTLEEVDVARHREITSKAVSAILLLLLKWFKASHIIKFQHLATLLIDSNCLLLILKMFGFQDLLNTVQTRNEWEDHNFFRYCYLNFSPERHARQDEDLFEHKPKPNSTRIGADGVEIEIMHEYSWRNFFYSINFIRVVHQLTKRRPARISLLVQYKSSQILKRLLRVSHPMLQLQVLKVIKSQVPFCGRKWRQSNMKTITAIYLNCKPELRDEWLAAIDIDNEVEESNAAENALRTLIRFYHSKHYAIPQPGSDFHRRSESLASAGSAEPSQQHPTSVPGSLHRTDSEIFPPNRTVPRKESDDGDYNIETIMGAWLYEYEDLIAEVLGIDRAEEHVQQGLDLLSSPGGRRSSSFSGIQTNGTPWNRLNEIMKSRGMPDDEAISDSESVVSIGELGPDARFSTYDLEQDIADEPEDSFAARQRRKSTGNENTWEHISPEVSLLPKSPNERSQRRSSSGHSPLRPVIAPSAATDWLDIGTFDEEEEPGPMPIQEGTEDEEARGHMPADEVEAFFQV